MKTCTLCHSSFNIDALDQQIYGQLQIPEPTLCPMCRHQRRLNWRNDRTFYSGKSALSGESFISIYPPDTPYKIYKGPEWWSDRWNPTDYGRAFDFSRPFFEQFHELRLQVPRMNMDLVNCENSDYCNYSSDEKNCYLDIAAEANQDSYYNLFVKYSQDIVDCTFVYRSRLCYESINCYDAYGLIYCQYCENTSDSAFCFDLKGCESCLFSSNLRNKKHYIFNQPHSKAEYEKKKAELNLGSYKNFQQAIKIWQEWFPKNTIFRAMVQSNCQDCLGNDLQNCKNVQFGFNALNCEDSKYLYDVLDAKNCLDMNYSLYKPELAVDCISSLNMTHSAFSMNSHYNHQIFYCDQMNNSKYCFGCSGLSRKEYCILNKQYNKDEYLRLRDRIIAHMQKIGEWGQFMPAQFSPHAYNETVAQEYFPLGQSEAEKKGFRWRQMSEGKRSDAKRLSNKLQDDIKETSQEICKEILQCQESKKGYRITEPELHFYKKMNLPVPRRSPQQRHLDRNARRAARKLWSSNCDNCRKTIYTAFDPGRNYRTYCEACYLKKVY